MFRVAVSVSEYAYDIGPRKLTQVAAIHAGYDSTRQPCLFARGDTCRDSEGAGPAGKHARVPAGRGRKRGRQHGNARGIGSAPSLEVRLLGPLTPSGCRPGAAGLAQGTRPRKEFAYAPRVCVQVQVIAHAASQEEAYRRVRPPRAQGHFALALVPTACRAFSRSYRLLYCAWQGRVGRPVGTYSFRRRSLAVWRPIPPVPRGSSGPQY
jgi:hypothetical protein